MENVSVVIPRGWTRRGFNRMIRRSCATGQVAQTFDRYSNEYRLQIFTHREGWNFSSFVRPFMESPARIGLIPVSS